MSEARVEWVLGGRVRERQSLLQGPFEGLAAGKKKRKVQMQVYSGLFARSRVPHLDWAAAPAPVLQQRIPPSTSVSTLCQHARGTTPYPPHHRQDGNTARLGGTGAQRGGTGGQGDPKWPAQIQAPSQEGLCGLGEAVRQGRERGRVVVVEGKGVVWGCPARSVRLSQPAARLTPPPPPSRLLL